MSKDTERKAYNKRLHKALTAAGQETYRAFQDRKEEHRRRLMAEGAEDANAAAVTLTLAEFPQIVVPPADQATADGDAGPKAETEGERALREARAKREEQARQQAFKEKLCSEAADRDDYRAWVKWAAKWQPVAWVDGIIRWDRVGEQAPNAAAVGILEQACLDPAAFYGQTMKNALGKQTDAEEVEIVAREKKREAELIKLLREVDAEIEARGEDAYT